MTIIDQIYKAIEENPGIDKETLRKKISCEDNTFNVSLWRLVATEGSVKEEKGQYYVGRSRNGATSLKNNTLEMMLTELLKDFTTVGDHKDRIKLAEMILRIIKERW